MNGAQTIDFKRILPFSLLNFLLHMFQWSYFVFLPLHLSSKNMPDDRIGVVMSLFPIAMVLLVMPMGMLADIANTRVLFIAASIMILSFNYFISHAESYHTILMSTLCGGMGYALFAISLTSLYLKRVGTENRGTKVALYNLSASMGVAVGIPFIGYFYEVLEVKNILFILGYTLALIMGTFSLFMPKAPIERFNIIEYVKDLKRFDTLIVVLVVFITASHVGIEQSCYTLFLESHVALTKLQIGIVFFVVSIWISSVIFVAGRVFNNTRKPFLALGIAIAISGFFQMLTAFAPDMKTVLALRMGHTIGDGTFNLLQTMLFTLVFPVARMGGNIGFANFVGFFSMSLFAVLGGVWSKAFGRDVALMISGALMMLAAFILLVNLKRLRRSFLKDENPE